MADYGFYDTAPSDYRNFDRMGSGGQDRYDLAVYPVQEPPPVTAYLEKDATTFTESLQPIEIPAYAPIAEQVFGAQSRQSKISLEHILNLVKERSHLHKRHLDDIEWRHREIQGQLFGARQHAKLDNHRRETMLQNTLVKLDAERRKEELAFWKDTTELREKLFEAASEYQAARQRASILSSAESPRRAYG